MSAMKSSNKQGMTHPLSPAPRFSKREQAALMTGPKVNIYLGEAPNGKLLFSAPRQLLSKFSPTWEDQLTAEPTRALYVPGTFAKEPVKFTVEWMAAGDTYSTAKGAVPYPKGDLINLLCLHKLAAHLGVGRLQEETTQSIDWYTRSQNMCLKTIDKVSRKSDVLPVALAIIKTNLKKIVRGPMNQAWSEEAKAHPGSFQSGLSFLASLGKEAVQEKEAQRKERTSHEKHRNTIGKPPAAPSASKGKATANVSAGNGKGLQNPGRRKFKGSKKVAEGTKNNAGTLPASPTPINNSGKAATESPRAAKVSTVCFNCGQLDHTRPYCSNSRVFLGHCYVCGQQGHRAADCPTKAATQEEGTKKKSNAGNKNQKVGVSKNVRQSVEPVLPPMVAHIVFVKDAENISNKSTEAGSFSAPASPSGSVSSAPKGTPPTSPETTPPPTKPSELKDKRAKQADKVAEREARPRVHRFITKKIRALNIAADGSVKREMIPGHTPKQDSSKKQSQAMA